MAMQNIKVTVDALVFSNSDGHLQLLLIKRKNDPFKGLWAFPGGFVDDDEELETAALRELHEETGMRLPAIKQLHTFGKVGRDPRFRTVSVVYYTFVHAHDHQVRGGDDAAEAQWVTVKDIHELAFDHFEILEFALQQLKDRLPSTATS
jgi:8-oxo-dGTP diphosphatase